MSPHDIVMSKFKKRRVNFHPNADSSPIKPKPQPQVTDDNGEHIYHFIPIHSGSPEVTELYINGTIPLTHDTPTTRVQVASMLSIKVTLEHALKGEYDEFIIDGIKMNKSQASMLLSYPVTVIGNELYKLL